MVDKPSRFDKGERINENPADFWRRRVGAGDEDMRRRLELADEEIRRIKRKMEENWKLIHYAWDAIMRARIR